MAVTCTLMQLLVIILEKVFAPPENEDFKICLTSRASCPLGTCKVPPDHLLLSHCHRTSPAPAAVALHSCNGTTSQSGWRSVEPSSTASLSVPLAQSPAPLWEDADPQNVTRGPYPPVS